MKIVVDPTFSIPVKLSTPGVAELAEIQVVFKHKNRDDVWEWAKRPIRVTEDGIRSTGFEATYIDEVIASWSGPVDDKGVAVPYSLVALTQLMMGRPAAGAEFYQQYLKAETESRLKN